MNLTFLLFAHDTGNTLWRSCQSLKAALIPGDQVLLIDLASTDDSAALMTRFGQWPGWGDEVETDLIPTARANATDPAFWASLASTQAKHDYCLCLDGGDLLQHSPVAALRKLLKAGRPDLVVANHAHYVIGPASTLPCPDADRWPDLGGDLDTALHLTPDPRRLIASRDLLAKATPTLADLPPWQAYEHILRQAQSLRLMPEVLRLAPLPASDPPDSIPDSPPARAAIFAIRDHLLATPRGDQPAMLDRLQCQLDDIVALLHPAQADDALDALAKLMRVIPRRLRNQAISHKGLSGPILTALHRNGPDVAFARLMPHFAIHERRQVEAMAKELHALREDLDLALPGPDYLIEMHERLRRV